MPTCAASRRTVRVERVETVVVEKDLDTVRYSAAAVVSSCGAINSAALLLRSANESHPNGLANSSGVVGRHYMAHNNSALLALSKAPNPTVFQKTLALNDYYFGSEDWEYPLGHIQMLGKSNAIMLEAEAPKFAPGMALEYMAAMDFWLTTEDLPDPENRVVLGEDGGIRVHYKENNAKSHQRLVAKLKGMLGEIGCEDKLVLAISISARRSRSPVSPISVEPFVSDATRKRRRWTSTAKLMISTTSTSWTVVFSSPARPSTQASPSWLTRCGWRITSWSG